MKAVIAELRAIVLSARDGVTEHIKWNAPSFCFGGEDRVTMRLQDARVQLVFHRGARAKDATGFCFRDDTGLLELVAVDRGVVAFSDVAEVRRQ